LWYLVKHRDTFTFTFIVNKLIKLANNRVSLFKDRPLGHSMLVGCRGLRSTSFKSGIMALSAHCVEIYAVMVTKKKKQAHSHIH